MVGGRERVRVGILFVVFTCICHSNILIEIYITCVLLREGVPTGPVLPGTGYSMPVKEKIIFLIFLFIIRGHMVEVILITYNKSWGDCRCTTHMYH